MNNKKNILAVFGILAAASLWGTAGIFIRNLEGNFSQMNIVMGRTFLTALILALIILIKDKSLFKIKLKDLPFFIASGVFSIIMFNFCYYKTMQYTTLSVAAVLLYTAPFFVVFISAFLFKERLNLKKILCCLLAFVGCCMVSGLFDSHHSVSTKALIYGILTGFGYALYTVFGEILLKRGYNSLTISFYVFAAASVGCLFMGDFKDFFVSASHKNGFLILLLMAIINTVLPYILYTGALKNIETSKAPIIAIAEPVVATLIGTFVFGEEVSLLSVAGIFVVLISVAVLNMNFGEKNGTHNAKG